MAVCVFILTVSNSIYNVLTLQTILGPGVPQNGQCEKALTFNLNLKFLRIVMINGLRAMVMAGCVQC